jgi:CheY-like chemotaxis protein
MPMIVVVDDDSTMRMLIRQMLRNQGHDVVLAENGRQGLELIRECKPQLIISDVQMPLMDGFDLLAAVRQDLSLATTPFILLTALQERSHVRQGMAAGADDYLSKPFSTEELRLAVDAQINKLIRSDMRHIAGMRTAVDMEMQRQRREISKLYEMRLARALSEQWPVSGGQQDGGKFNHATVLYADIQDYDRWNATLSSDELSEVINFLYSCVGDTVHLFGAHHMQFVGEGMLCVFVDEADTVTVNHALRAVRAALGLADATRRVNAFVRNRFAGRPLPRFAATVALDSGAVAFTQLSGLFGSTVHSTPVGSTVTAALRLFHCTPGLNWTMACSVQTARLIDGKVRLGEQAVVTVPGRAMALEVVEVLSLLESTAAPASHYAATAWPSSSVKSSAKNPPD